VDYIAGSLQRMIGRCWIMLTDIGNGPNLVVKAIAPSIRKCRQLIVVMARLVKKGNSSALVKSALL
jgi:hypothetical protein